jgi:hypothetical protein
MLAYAAVARARYYTPASVVAALVRDPVVTSNGDRIRFESFSGCCGSKVTEAARRLLQVAAVEAPERGLAGVEALEGMITRAPVIA